MTIDLLWRGVAVIYASDEPTAKRVATLIKSRGVAAYAFPHFTLDKIWGCFDAYVFVMAAGGVVRSLCGRLKDKWSDPPVLIVDHNLSTILPILGHHRGADELADWLASLLGAKVVHTTMSRHLGFSPVEAVERQMLCKLNNADILEIYKTL
ncbi:MAG: cobalamin biosynthesis protein CbiG, partial [Pyrobaculum sp.]